MQVQNRTPTTELECTTAVLPALAPAGERTQAGAPSAGALMAPELSGCGLPAVGLPVERPEPQLPEERTIQEACEVPLEPVLEALLELQPELEPAPRPARGLGRRAARLLRHGLGAALLALVFYTLSFHLSVVRGSSMSPGIHDGDRILVEPWSYVFANVQRGDVVVMQSPVDPAVDYIKRVIGLPGDEVLIAAGGVWVNGHLLTEPYAVPGDRDLFQWTRVLNGHYFVLGDNRPQSSDSREFGQVPARYLRGRVDVRVWPPLRAGWVQ